MHGFGEHGWWMGMGFWWIIGLILVVLVIWLVARSSSKNRSNEYSGSKSSLDILKNRYAKGEIDKEEFEEKKKDLIR